MIDKKEEIFEDQKEKLKIIQHITSIFSKTFDSDTLLQLVLENLIAISKAKNGIILVKDEKVDLLKIKYFKNVKEDELCLIIDSIGKYIETLFLDGESKKLNLKSNDLYLSDTNNYNAIVLLLPIKIEDRVIGVINLNDVNKDPFTDFDFELIHTISMLASQKLSKINIYNELEQKIREKDILIDISNSIEKVFVLKDVFDVVMKKLTDKFGILRGMLVLFEKDNINRLSVFSAYNLTEEEASRGIYKVGEGVVGKVVENGRAISVPNINNDNLFLNRMKIKRDKTKPISFTAVPIKISGIVFGVLAFEKYFISLKLLKDEEDMLFLISGIIANKVKIYKKMSEEKSILLEENINLKKELYEKYGFDNIVGKNKKMQHIFELIKMVADSNSSILITGESGTGKELVAKALHFNSGRKFGPFISINCAAIPDNLLESELFGYKKGAFTGAESDKKGKFFLADGGTLFLDEIGDMPLYLQAKLLRALQEKEIEPIGSELKVKINIRIVSATNKDPVSLVKTGKLREDLYYRLNVVEIKLPPLKDRRDDIPLLTQYFIEKYSNANKKKIKRVSPDALRILQAYHWPGNIRELENIIERAILLSKGNMIEIHDLPSFIINTDEYHLDELYIERWIEKFVKDKINVGNAHDVFMKIVEKEFIIKSFMHNKRNKVKTSRFLGINRNTLRSKMEKYKIDVFH